MGGMLERRGGRRPEVVGGGSRKRKATDGERRE